MPKPAKRHTRNNHTFLISGKKEGGGSTHYSLAEPFEVTGTNEEGEEVIERFAERFTTWHGTLAIPKGTLRGIKQNDPLSKSIIIGIDKDGLVWEYGGGGRARYHDETDAPKTKKKAKKAKYRGKKLGEKSGK